MKQGVSNKTLSELRLIREFLRVKITYKVLDKFDEESRKSKLRF